MKIFIIFTTTGRYSSRVIKQVKFFMPSGTSPHDMSGPFKKIFNLTLESAIIKID